MSSFLYRSVVIDTLDADTVYNLSIFLFIDIYIFIEILLFIYVFILIIKL